MAEGVALLEAVVDIVAVALGVAVGPLVAEVVLEEDVVNKEASSCRKR